MTPKSRYCIFMFEEIKRGVAQVVARYFREVEAASSSLVTPIMISLIEITNRLTPVFDESGPIEKEINETGMVIYERK